MLTYLKNEKAENFNCVLSYYLQGSNESCWHQGNGDIQEEERVASHLPIPDTISGNEHPAASATPAVADWIGTSQISPYWNHFALIPKVNMV